MLVLYRFYSSRKQVYEIYVLAFCYRLYAFYKLNEEDNA
jgi:hypothetical protein